MTPAPSWVWGVDVAVARLDFSFIDENGAFQVNHLVVDPALKGAARLAALFNSTYDFAGNVARCFPPLIVYVEQPTGAHSNPALDHATGVARASIYRALSGVFKYPVSVELVAVSSWKKLVLGSGSADKAQVAEWAAELGYSGVQDGADALGIGACAALELGRPGPSHPIVH